MKKSNVVVQKWEESERGWGTRPDGYSLHLTEEDRKKYIEEYTKGRDPHDVPDEYDRPDGTPYIAEVDAETFQAVVNSKYGIRKFDRNYPGSGGTDGWRNSTVR